MVVVILPKPETITGGQIFNENVARILQKQGAELVYVKMGNTGTAKGLAEHIGATMVKIPLILKKISKNQKVLYLSASGVAKNATILIHHSLRSWHKKEECIGYTPSIKARIKRIILEHLEEIAAKTSTKIIVPSITAKEDILKDYNVPKDKIAVVKQGVNKKLFRPLKTEPECGFFFVPNIFASPLKGASLLLKAYEKAVDDGVETPLIITARVVPQWAKRILYKISPKSRSQIKIIDRLPRHKLPEYYWNARAVLYPSIYEGYGRVPLEAIASGAVVVTNNTVPVSNDIKEWAIITTPRVADWRDILVQLENDAILRRTRTRAIAGSRKIPTWEDTARMIMFILEGA